MRVLRSGGGNRDLVRRHLPTASTGTGTRLRFGGGANGIERLAASLDNEGFAPHRHDTYAVGMTLRGIQTFRYRGQRRVCRPGEWHVLHPDEIHDGVAGTAGGFGYRIIYLDPYLVQQALGGAPLPFVADPVVRPERMDPHLTGWLRDIDEPLDDGQRVEVALAIADALRRHAGFPPSRRAPLPIAALTRVRDLIAADPAVRHPAEAYEAAAGLDRWTIARHFRAAFGTSPTRFRTLRQLDRARTLMRTGQPLADVAAAVGFADQSHLTRMFKRAYGLTPAAWLAAVHGPPGPRWR